MLRTIRRDYLTKPIFRWAQKALPSMSETEREAIEAGDVWWDAELFTGNPDWKTLLDTPQAALSAEEQAFVDGPVDEFCAMIDDWQITWEDGDLPREAWDFLKRNRFFGMIIPKEYGGLGFSAFAHSEIVRKISTRSVAAAVSVMVPNSLGPGELLMQFGTKEQRDHWLPRLADGREVPCFGLTSLEAGSDAASMVDSGVVCRDVFDGEEVVGLRLNWKKRYITLAPIATVLGLAFKLYDPEHILGPEVERGITVALIPTDLPGVETGRRHLAAMQFFQNGPTEGHDVFIPLDHIIGGEKQVGKGWKMLMSALAAGRGISLPSQAAAAAAASARYTGAYARIRSQFGIPVGRFEGVQDRLGAIAGNAYLIDGARRLTCAGLDKGHHPAVISAIMKAHATYRMRDVMTDAMDIHGGKTVIDGPRNYLGNFYRAIPVGITVEGANILTRNLIIFGQGSIRAHPWLIKEMNALQIEDRKEALDAFDRAFWGHVGHSAKTFFRAWGRALTGGRFAPRPDAGAVSHHYARLGRYSAAFALAADMALLTLGGALKRKEALSARLGDVLSELYLLSGVLKRWEDEGRQEADLPLVQWCMEMGSARIEQRLDEIYINLPARWAAVLLRLVTLPYGVRSKGPRDKVTQACAELILEPNATRDRLGSGLYVGGEDTEVGRLEHTLKLVVAVEPIRQKLRKERLSWRQGLEKRVITEEEARKVEAAEAAIAEVCTVDDFPPGELSKGARPRSTIVQAAE
ncbi:acyl-CoA dehydrogenase [Lutibaculum baratangense]|uniref:Acyl-coenzyme A dehydrogenase n=1 Tax=Lutibaculum baratangense AMV1 TaxID=631454 RepID=V4RCF6_9HYPH|nr:acyl-CoA dehydrogenase [Lutibaculum baratangense]ESR23851.1 putative acyl-CoA dehydrogenase [Lutibaculum baratangense AMV1]